MRQQAEQAVGLLDGVLRKVEPELIPLKPEELPVDPRGYAAVDGAHRITGTITAFARRMFGPERQVRIRSSYFPSTDVSLL